MYLGIEIYGPDRRWKNDCFIVLSLTVVSDFLSAFVALDLADSPALIPATGVTFHVSRFDLVVSKVAIRQESICA